MCVFVFTEQVLDHEGLQGFREFQNEMTILAGDPAHQDRLENNLLAAVACV